MSRYLLALIALIGTVQSGCAQHEPAVNEASSELFGGKKVLVAYFSWGGTTERFAEEIATQTGATLFRIEPVNPYPSEYTPCTEVAKEELESNARPEIKGNVEDWDRYDIVFIGCPVWWHTAPMIISTFTENYDFSGKTVVPFCTYAATYRDETLRKIVELTPLANHLEGLGTTGSTSPIGEWLQRISAQYHAQTAGIADVQSDADSDRLTYYTLDGIAQHSKPQRPGLYIVSDGYSSKKVIL